MKRYLLIFCFLLSLISVARGDVYFYQSPFTEAFFAQNGTDYETLRGRWLGYLRQQRPNDHHYIDQPRLLKGLKSNDVLILASAVLLSPDERAAIDRHLASGGALLLTWGTGARNEKGGWVGFADIERWAGIKTEGLLPRSSDAWFLNLYGETPLTWQQPAGRRFFLGKTAELPVLFSATASSVAARYFDWGRSSDLEKHAGYEKTVSQRGSISFSEISGSRRVYMGFAESSWDYLQTDEWYPVLDGILDWLTHQPRAVIASWPNGVQSAHLIEMDTESGFSNAINLAKALEDHSFRGTFYCLTSEARKHADLVKMLSKNHEIGYHGDVHFGFKGKTPDEQARRISNMVAQMQELAGPEIAASAYGFRAPTESYDEITTDRLLDLGIRYQVNDPAGTEGRLPYFMASKQASMGHDFQLLALPRTQNDDLNLESRKYSKSQASQVVLEDLKLVHEMGGLGVLSIHSQNYDSDHLMTEVTRDYLGALKSMKGSVWVAKGRDIEQWWRQRDKVKLRQSAEGELILDAQQIGIPEGLAIRVMNPGAKMELKDVRINGATASGVKIQATDAYRSLIVLPKMSAGTYRITLKF